MKDFTEFTFSRILRILTSSRVLLFFEDVPGLGFLGPLG